MIEGVPGEFVVEKELENDSTLGQPGALHGHELSSRWIFKSHFMLTKPHNFIAPHASVTLPGLRSTAPLPRFCVNKRHPIDHPHCLNEVPL